MQLESVSIKTINDFPSLQVSFIHPLLNEVNNRVVFTGGTPEQHTQLIQFIMLGFYPLMNFKHSDYLNYLGSFSSKFYQIKLVLSDEKGNKVYVINELNSIKVDIEGGMTLNEFLTYHVPNIHVYKREHKGDIKEPQNNSIVLLDTPENYVEYPQYFISHLSKGNTNTQFICTTWGRDILSVISPYEIYEVFNKEKVLISI